jgi:hypothetical protein
MRLGFGIGPTLVAVLGRLARTRLRRAANGSATLLELGQSWQPRLTRAADGSVTISE